MKRNHTQCVALALGLLVVLMTACAPVLTPAQQTAIAATGKAAANDLLTPSLAPQSPATTTAAATGTSTTTAGGVPVTGGTAPAMTSTPPVSATTSATGTSSSNGFTTSIPNTGATSAAPTSSLGGPGCQDLLTSGSAGPLALLWINNKTGADMNFTMGIPTANSQGQCGYLTFGPIGPGNTLRVRVPVTQTSLGDSCYWAFAAPVNQGRQAIVNGNSAGYCITTPQRWVMNIRSDQIRLVGP